MNFEEILDQAVAMLQRRGRVTYRILSVSLILMTTLRIFRSQDIGPAYVEGRNRTAA
jgi:hypothetical protein